MSTYVQVLEANVGKPSLTKMIWLLILVAYHCSDQSFNNLVSRDYLKSMQCFLNRAKYVIKWIYGKSNNIVLVSHTMVKKIFLKYSGLKRFLGSSTTKFKIFPIWFTFQTNKKSQIISLAFTTHTCYFLTSIWPTQVLIQ